MTDQELETMVDRLIDHAKVCPHHAEQLDHILRLLEARQQKQLLTTA